MDAVYRPDSGLYQLRTVQDAGNDWGSTEYGQAALAGAAIIGAGAALITAGGSAAVTALGIGGLVVAGGVAIVLIGAVIAIYSGFRLIQIANGKFAVHQGGGGGEASRQPKTAGIQH